MSGTTTLNESTRTVDGTESVRLATTGANWKATISAIKTWVFGLVSGDGTISSAGALVVTKTNGVAFATVATSGSKSDVGLGSVTNDVQTKAAVVPNTAPSAGQLLVGNAGGTAYAPVAASGDATVASTGAVALTAAGRLQSKLISFTRDVSVASGTQGVTGVGFVPTAVIFFAAGVETTELSVGAADSARTSGSMWQSGSTTTATNTNTSAITYANGAGTTSYTGVVNSYDADGFTIGWTKVGAPTGTLTVKALCLR